MVLVFRDPLRRDERVQCQGAGGLEKGRSGGGFLSLAALRGIWIFFSSVQDSLYTSSVQLLSYVQLFATLWTTAHQASLSITTPGVHSDSCPSSR